MSTAHYLAAHVRDIANEIRKSPNLSRDVIATMLDRTATLIAYGYEEPTGPLPLTKSQSKILDYLTNYVAEHGYAPSFEEIGTALGYRSLGTVHEHLTSLENKGHIIRRRNEARAITLVASQAEPVPEIACSI